MIKLSINGESRALDVDPSTPLLWVIRDYAGLTGTKFGCGIAQCGACTVHVDGKPVRSCITPASAAVGRQITTIEGVNGGKFVDGVLRVAANQNHFSARPRESDTHRAAEVASAADDNGNLTRKVKEWKGGLHGIDGDV